MSVAHAYEVAAYAQLFKGEVQLAQRSLLKAMSIYDLVEHLGCSLHCIETVAWWAGVDDRRDAGAELLGLVSALRSDLGRVRIQLEELPNREATRICGVTNPVATNDLLARTTSLAQTILAPRN